MTNTGDFYRDVIDNLYDGVYFVNRDRVITFWNKGAERITGYGGARVVGRACRDNLLNHVTANGQELCRTNCPLAACMEDGLVREAQVFLHHADGHRLPVVVRASPMRDESGNIIGAVEMFSSDERMVAVRKEMRALRRVTQTDALTAIGNRLHLERSLRALLAGIAQQDSAAGLLFMDVDRFKHVNDLHGHEVGDKVLRMIAATLRHSLRASDVVGRWGGEEFLVILYDLNTREDLRSVAEKMRVLVECSRLDLPGGSLTVTISTGATLALPDGSPESLVRRADELMYRSKQAGRNRVSVG